MCVGVWVCEREEPSYNTIHWRNNHGASNAKTWISHAEPLAACTCVSSVLMQMHHAWQCMLETQHKSIYIHQNRNDLFVQFITESPILLWRQFPRLLIEIIATGRTSPAPSEEEPLLQSKSLIFCRKSSRRIFGKWESGYGKWSSSVGYSVITVFFCRPCRQAIFKLVVKSSFSQWERIKGKWMAPSSITISGKHVHQCSSSYNCDICAGVCTEILHTLATLLWSMCVWICVIQTVCWCGVTLQSEVT